MVPGPGPGGGVLPGGGDQWGPMGTSGEVISQSYTGRVRMIETCVFPVVSVTVGPGSLSHLQSLPRTHTLLRGTQAYIMRLYEQTSTFPPFLPLHVVTAG